MGTESKYPPYSQLGENDEPVGFNVEVTRALARVTGLDVEIDYRPWGEIRDDLENGGIDGYTFKLTPLDFEEIAPAVEEGKVEFILGGLSFYITLEARYGANRIATGFPTLLCGGPGCGKTTIPMEFIAKGARDYDEPGVFISFEEEFEYWIEERVVSNKT